MAAGALARPGAVAQLGGALVAFCLLSSATYLVNDVRDLRADREHPRKRLRPIAAGELSPGRALRLALLLALAGLALSLAVRPLLALVSLSYLGLTLSYSFVWREVMVADVVVVAMGFLLRAAAGGAAVGVRLSSSFLIVTSACALFLVLGKRYGELCEGRSQATTRATLRRYSRRVLRRLLVGAGAVACLAYAHWAFSRPELGPWLELSVLPFVMWLARYSRVAEARGATPEELILRDRALILLGISWAIVFVTGLYVAP
jgi:decaprenyl-phosphate phosphoribosyltransferase